MVSEFLNRNYFKKIQSLLRERFAVIKCESPPGD